MTTWDAIVIGAGPAGSLAARQSAHAGLRTLLVDAKVFPREKVCGGYLNHRAIEVLKQTRLAHLAVDRPEEQVNQLELIWGRQRTRFQLPPGRVICRTTFDAALLESARDRRSNNSFGNAGGGRANDPRRIPMRDRRPQWCAGDS